jgi:hypothetical protein
VKTSKEQEQQSTRTSKAKEQQGAKAKQKSDTHPTLILTKGLGHERHKLLLIETFD